MSRVVKAASRLKPEIRLAQAISEFESDLQSDQKAEFRSIRANSIKTPPTTQDVMIFTARIDRSFANGNPCVAPRLMSVLQVAQQFASLGDILIGGSQNLIACGIWTLVRMTMTIMTTVSSFVEKLSKLFMEIGRSAPRFEKMALVYHQSRDLQADLCEYFTLVVHLCHDVLKFSQKSHLARIGLSLVDSSLERYREELGSWGMSIRDQVTYLQAQRGETEAKLNTEFRNDSSAFWQISSLQQRVQARQRVLGFCSQYDHTITWRQIRKQGNTILFCQCTEYQSWKFETKGQTLFFVGKLGSGKSVLLANLLDDLNLHSIQGSPCPVAFFFCRHDITESLKSRVVVGSLARQMLSQVPNAERAVEVVEQANANDHDPFMTIFDILKQVLPSTYRPFIVIDGIDELNGSETETLIENLQRFQKLFDASLCISVREDPANWLKTVSGQLLNSKVVPMPDNRSEIETFITKALEKLLQSSRIAIGDPKLILEIQDALVKGSQGMFLWVALQIEALCTMADDYAIRQALQDLPKDLSETFSRALQRSRKFSPTLQEKILNLITVAQRPLSPEEMRLALSIIPGKPIWDSTRLPNDIYTGLASCGGLVVLDEDGVKQYLISGPKDAGAITIRLESAHEEMTHKLITYLNYSQFENQLGRQVVPRVTSGRAMNTIISTTRSAASGSSRLALSLLRSNSTGGFNIGRSLAEAQRHSPSQTISVLHDYAKEYWTAHLPWCFPLPPRIHTLFQNLCGREGLANSKRGEILLGWAVQHQSMDLVRYLIESLDIDINSRVDDQHRTALHIASTHGFDHIVENLVKFRDINVTLTDSNRESPISIALEGQVRFESTALESDFISIIKILLGTEQIKVLDGDLTPTFEELIASRPQKIILLFLDSIIAIEQRRRLWHTITKMIPTGDDEVFKLIVEHRSTPFLEGNISTQYFPLHLAIIGRRKSKIEILLDSGKVDPWLVDSLRQTPFHLAAVQDNLELLKRFSYWGFSLGAIPGPLFAGSESDNTIPKVLFKRPPFPVYEMKHNERDIYGDTGLHLATKYGHIDSVDLILSLPETDANIQNFQGATPLHLAAKLGYNEILSSILTHSPSRRSLAIADSLQNKPLHLAAAVGYGHIVAILLEHCSLAIVNSKNREGCTPLNLAAMGGYSSVMELLVTKYGIGLNLIDASGRTALHHAVLSKEYESVDLLLQNGVDPWILDKDMRTPLHLATMEGCVSIMERLVAKKGVDLNAIDTSRQTLLHHAVLSGEYKAVNLILQKGANLCIPDKDMRTPLHLAAMEGSVSIMELLIAKCKVDLDAIDTSGRNALHHAALSDKCKAVDLLLQKGANPFVRDKELSTPLHRAAQLGNYDIAMSLLRNLNAVAPMLPGTVDQKGRTPLYIDVPNDHSLADAVDQKGRTPLHIAVQNDHLVMAAFLLDTGLLNVDERDRQGLRAVDIASQCGHELMRRLIIFHDGYKKS